MFKRIEKFIIERKNRKNEELRQKWYELRYHVIKFYEDLQATKPRSIDIPAFQIADKKMKEIIKTQKDLNFYYKKLKKYGLARV